MSSSAHKTIVIIDDDEDDCYLVQIGLQRSHPDYEVVAITDSIRVIDQLAVLPQIPQLILLDLHMPVSGADVLTQLKGLPQYKSVPIAVFSSLLSPSVLAHVEQIGVTTMIEKSTDPDAISAEVDKILSSQ